ncbi:response regulator [Lacibacter luteus]|uniref:histidine kinase n=1 Tax=Lacibacter luteus TaxID=2508719 RepID=A0A4Q1CLM6_9BACT|nr:two-component regulator propeller domain-containing protein [Lacibacter luteus]RXK61654.1 response regulator [Lacibacter luteus]
MISVIRKRQLHFLLIGIIITVIPLNAQIPVAYLGINQGLSNNSVRCILRDHKGFMWFGTYDGLNRYDGYSFRIFRSKVNDSTSLINPFINTLSEDKNGHLWIGTRGGVSIYNSLTDKFNRLSVKADKKNSILNDVIRAIGTDSSNNVFVGAENSGLFFCKNGSPVSTSVALTVPGGTTTRFGVQAIKISKDNKVWVFVQNRGLCLFDYASMKLQLIDSTAQTASAIDIDGNDIWIGGLLGLYHYDIAQGKGRPALEIPVNSEKIWSVTVDREHNLWIGTVDKGVNIWNTRSNSMEFLNAGDSKFSLLSGYVYAIYEDPNGRIWIGTLKGGVNIIDPQKKKFRLIAHDAGIPGGLSGNSVSCFFEANDGSLWIGTDDAGLSIWDRKKNKFTNLQSKPGNENSLPSDAIETITSDADNNIWVGTFNAGLCRLYPDGKISKRYKCINPLSGLENPVISILYSDSKKTLWASTLRQGLRYGALYYYNRLNDRFEAFDTGLSDLFCLTEDKSGNFWGGNLNQLVKIDRVTKRHEFFTLGQPVKAIYEDRKGNFWIGTEGGGLILFDRQQKKIKARFTVDEGLCSDAVLNILEDAAGHLWISTLNGLSRFDPASKVFKNYYYNDGLQSNQFNYNSALILRSGEFLFGGIKGFNLFHPEQITSVTTFPPLVVTSIKVNNSAINADNAYVMKTSQDEITELKMPYNQAVISVEFAALEYSIPEKISYAYYLEGWDRNWNYSGKTRIANYTHLSEGTYTLRIKVTDVEGNWSKSERTIRIVILPPWFRTWWAYTSYLLIVASLIYVFWLYRHRQTKLKYEIAFANISIEKEKAEAEKHRAEYEKEKAIHEADRIVSEKEKELNTKRLDFFTSITHEFRTPLTLIINPVKDFLQNKREVNDKKGDMTIVYRNARRLLSLVDQLLFFRKTDAGIDKIKPAKLNFYTLSHEVFLCFVQQARLRNIQYEFIADNPELELYADREKMEIVLYNLLSNAIKYTPDKGRIIFQIVETDSEVEVIVKDTGAGIPKEAGEKLFDKFYQAKGPGVQTKPGFGIGLYLVKQLVEMHNGSVSYESILEKGTTFKIALKKDKDHFKDVEVFESKNIETSFLNELNESDELLSEETEKENTEEGQLQSVFSAKQIMLVVDDDKEIRSYVSGMFRDQFNVYEAQSGKEGLKMAEKHQPDIIISDIKMEDGDGIDFCRKIKSHNSLSHIPVILLTGTHTSDLKLEGVEGGADDYITKPFEKELLLARVNNLQKSRINLQRYFFNEITLKKHDLKISEEDKEFLERCIAIVEEHLEDDEFTITQLATQMGRSYSSVYKRIRMISGQSLQGFVRFVRLRKAAELFINTNQNVGEVAFKVGIYDAKFFREQFHKLFGLKPSEYIKKYRKPFQDQFLINPESGL